MQQRCTECGTPCLCPGINWIDNVFTADLPDIIKRVITSRAADAIGEHVKNREDEN